MAKAVIGPVRFSYLNVYEPADRNNDGNPKYSATILIDKNDKDSIAKINQAIKAAEQEGKEKKFEGKIPPKVPNPIHDGDGVKQNSGEEYGPECKNHLVLTATSRADNPPGLIAGQDRHPAERGEIKSGDYGYVSLNFAPYNFQNKKGIGAYLNNIFKTKDGEPLGVQRTTPEEDFKDLIGIEFDEEPDVGLEDLIG